jgi:hypothetical protein
MDSGRLCSLLVGVCLLGACQTAPSSLEHHTDSPKYGNAPPALKPGGSGPAELKAVAVADVALPNDPNQLLRLYHKRLIEMAHQLPPAQREEYAAKEIDGLKKRYAGRNEAMIAELQYRLRPIIARPGQPGETRDAMPRYPDEAEAAPTDQRKPQ